MTATDEGSGTPARPPHPDGDPRPVQLPDFEAPLRNLDWEDPDYRGIRRRSRSRKKPKKRWYRPRNTLGIPALIIVLVLLAGVLYVNAQMSGIRRAPLAPEFSGIASAGTNVLLVSSKSPAHSLAADPDTMVIQLVHLSDSGRNASVVNLPSDLYLPDPTRSARKQRKDPRSLRLIDLYETGGVPLVAQAVQADLGLTVDHDAQIGLAGYARVTDRLGGVDLPTAKGMRHFTGKQAEHFTGDHAVTSIVAGTRNQAWLKAMLTATMTPSVLLNPFTMVGLLKDTKPNLVLDEAFTNGVLRGLLWRARHLRPSTIRYLTVPHRGYATRTVDLPGPKGKVVHSRVKALLPDLPGLRQLGDALRTDNGSGVAVFDN